jgi:uncharacterized protein YjbJ (UPF0337 family)
MSEARVEGTMRDFVGKVQDAAGGLTGDTATQVRGKINQAKGQAQQVYGDTVDEVRGFASEQPLTAVLAAIGIGAILGFFVARR